MRTRLLGRWTKEVKNGALMPARLAPCPLSAPERDGADGPAPRRPIAAGLRTTLDREALSAEGRGLYVRRGCAPLLWLAARAAVARAARSGTAWTPDAGRAPSPRAAPSAAPVVPLLGFLPSAGCSAIGARGSAPFGRVRHRLARRRRPISARSPALGWGALLYAATMLMLARLRAGAARLVQRRRVHRSPPSALVVASIARVRRLSRRLRAALRLPRRRRPSRPRRSSPASSPTNRSGASPASPAGAAAASPGTRSPQAMPRRRAQHRARPRLRAALRAHPLPVQAPAARSCRCCR